VSLPFPPIDFLVPPEDADGRYELLTGIGPDDFSASPYEQVASAFRNLERRLQTVGMEFSDVVRTWLYGADMLSWYPELNRARHDFFVSRGVFDRYVPASTGIGWNSGSGAKIVMGAFAVRTKRPGAVVFEAVPSPLQCPALEYGSSFSRAAEIRTSTWRRVVVSGTASLEPNSHVVAHVGDIDAQIDCTLRAVTAIYESRGLALSDVSGALVYLKDDCYRPAWERWLERHPEFPKAHAHAIVADVCRDDWLFEIESDALKKCADSPATGVEDAQDAKFQRLTFDPNL